MFGPVPPEHGFVPLTVEGEIPRELRLVSYFNGPGHFGAWGESYGHWFDGDGSLAAVRLTDGRAEGAYRTTASRGRTIESVLHRRIFSAYGTKAAWPLTVLHPRHRTKSSANTAVLCHDNEVYALMEGALPVKIQPHSLATMGSTNLGCDKMLNYSAHPVRLKGGRLVSTGLKISKEAYVELYETKGGVTDRIAKIEMRFATMVHSFAATESCAVLILLPLRLDKLRYLLNLGSFSELLRWEPQHGVEIVVVPFDDPENVTRFTIDPFFFWHIGQTFERGSDVLIDLIRYDDFGSHAWLKAMHTGGTERRPGGTLHRLCVDRAGRRATMERLSDRVVEFPVVNPRLEGPSSTMICGHESSDSMTNMIDTLVSVDLERGTDARFETGLTESYPSEVQLVPRGPHGRGVTASDAWALSMLYDPARHRSGLAVFDAQRAAAGPRGIAWFDHHVPTRFHGDYLRF